MDGLGLTPIQLAIDLERARHRMVTLVDGALWHLDATLASTRALRAVAASSGLIHAGEVARAMGVTRQAASVLLRRHEAAGHVTVLDEGWARSMRITPAGQEHLRRCTREIATALQRLGDLPEADLSELADQLDRLTKVLSGRGSIWLPDL